MRHSNQFKSTITTSQFLLGLFSSKYVFPAMIFVWFLYLAFAGSSDSKSLRGSKVDSTSFASEFHNIHKKPTVQQFTHLVVVAGHAVMRMNKLSVADKADDGWYLLAYQKNQGFPAIISSHVKKGIELTKSDESTMLVFSGGQTRRDVGPTSEAASYYYLAQEKKWMGRLEHRVFLEEYARDSFENLLFSVCRFREVAGHYPEKVSVVGFDFKGKRYSELHRKAIGFPAGNFTYVGVRSTHPSWDQAKAVTGESAALQSFANDLYGCNDPSLFQKREVRNPFRRTVPYELACPEMEQLLHWCGPGHFPQMDALPWRTQPHGDELPTAE